MRFAESGNREDARAGTECRIMMKSKGDLTQRGLLIVISGPSGSGKSSISKALLEIDQSLAFSVSATTRPPRAGEVHRVDYYFLSEEEFQRKIDAGEFAEWSEYNNHRYGTLKSALDKCLEDGQDILLEIEVQGAEQLRKSLPEGVFIFILPPSLASLELRLRDRRTESEEDIQQRLLTAKKEIQRVKNYNYVVFNHDNQLTQAVEKVLSIIAAEKCRVNEGILTQIQDEFIIDDDELEEGYNAGQNNRCGCNEQHCHS